MQRASGAPARLFSLRRWEFLAVLVAALLGVAVAVDVSYVLATIGAVILVYLLSRGPLTRAVVVIIGAITLLNVSPGVSVEKFAYLAILVLATLLASLNIASRWLAAQALGALPILITTGAVAAVVATSIFIARSSGVTIQAWALDVPAYGILVAAVILGLDLALSTHRPADIVIPFLLAGLITAVGYTIFWTERRGLTQFDLSRFVLASELLPAAALCLSLAYIFDGRRVYQTAVFATLLVLAMLVSGTRILILFVVPVIVTVAVAHGRRRLRVLSLVIVAGITLAVLGGVASNTALAGYLNLDALQARLGGIIPLLTSLTSLDITADSSVYMRFLETQALQQAWSQHPLLGVGPGLLYSYGGIVNDHPVDSPLAILARFGVIGAAALVGLFATLFVSRLRRGSHWVPATALLSFISLVAAWSLVSSPLDDKGVALGLIPLIGLCGVWRKEAHSPLKLSLNSEPGRSDVGGAPGFLRLRGGDSQKVG